MRSYVIPFALALFLIGSIDAQIVTLSVVGTGNGTTYSSEEIVLEAGDVAEILSSYSSTYTGSTGGAALEMNGLTFRWDPVYTTSNGAARIERVIAGPAKLKAYSTASGVLGFFTASIVRANSNQSYTPSGSVVIPNDATGIFDVILESSTDLITWTQANPGTYGGSDQKRFFRVRIVRQ